MTKLKKLILAAGVALAFGSGTASAGSVSSQLFIGPQLLSDSSSEKLINVAGGATTLDIGDRLLGIVTIEKTQQGLNLNPLGVGSVNDELTGIFDLEVVGKAVGGLGFNFVFAPTSVANFTADTGLVRGPGTMVAMFADPTQNFQRGGTVAVGIASVTGGTAVAFWDFGFTLAGFGSQFWVASSATDDITLVGAPGSAGGVFNFGVYQLAGGSGPALGPTPCFNPLIPGGVIVQACGNGTLTSKLAGSGWDSGNQAQIAVNRIPEPGTLALLGLGLLGFSLSLRRRK